MTSAVTPAALTAHIEAAVEAALGPRLDAVIDVSTNHYESWWSSAVVTARLAGGEAKTIFCKWSLPLWTNDSLATSWDIRRGVSYEANVYKTYLHEVSEGVPYYWGSTEAGSASWLLLEHLGDVLRLGKTTGDRLAQFGETLAGIHSALAGKTPRNIALFDEEFLDRWIDQAASNLDASGMHLLRSEKSRRRATELLAVLTESPTIVNGDLFPNNILLGAKHITLVDWESAAWANGVVDLAASLENWPPAMVTSALDAYCERRYGLSSASVSVPLSAGSAWLSIRFIASPKFVANPTRWLWYVERLEELLTEPPLTNGERIL